MTGRSVAPLEPDVDGAASVPRAGAGHCPVVVAVTLLACAGVALLHGSRGDG